MEIIQWNGKTIKKPGIYAGIPLARYHAGDICDAPSVSSSGLRTIVDDSAAAYWVKSPYNDERDKSEDEDAAAQSQAMVLGRAVHHISLGQPNFRKEFAVRPDELLGEKWQGNRKVCREWLAKAAADGFTVLSPDQVKKVVRMAKILDADPIAGSGVLRGHIEHSMFWKDADTGVWLKARPDSIPNDAFDFTDLKTARAVDDESCRRAIHEFSYHMQGALIGLGCRALFGEDLTSFNLIFQQSSEPHSINSVSLTNQDFIDDETGEVLPSALKRGATECNVAIKVFAKGMKTGEWLGPAGKQSDMKPMGLPGWAIRKRDYRLKQLQEEAS